MQNLIILMIAFVVSIQLSAKDFKKSNRQPNQVTGNIGKLTSVTDKNNVNALRIFCVAKSGKKDRCNIAVTINYETQKLEGSYVCSQDYMVLLTTHELTEENLVVSGADTQRSLAYNDGLTEFSLKAGVFDYSYGKIQEVSVKVGKQVFKGSCSGVNGYGANPVQIK